MHIDGLLNIFIHMPAQGVVTALHIFSKLRHWLSGCTKKLWCWSKFLKSCPDSKLFGLIFRGPGAMRTSNMTITRYRCLVPLTVVASIYAETVYSNTAVF